MQSNQSGTYQQFNSWIDTASPDELTSVGTQVLARINTLPEAQRQKFYDQIKKNPQTSKLFSSTSV